MQVFIAVYNSMSGMSRIFIVLYRNVATARLLASQPLLCEAAQSGFIGILLL